MRSRYREAVGGHCRRGVGSSAKPTRVCQEPARELGGRWDRDRARNGTVVDDDRDLGVVFVREVEVGVDVSGEGARGRREVVELWRRNGGGGIRHGDVVRACYRGSVMSGRRRKKKGWQLLAVAVVEGGGGGGARNRTNDSCSLHQSLHGLRVVAFPTRTVRGYITEFTQQQQISFHHLSLTRTHTLSSTPYFPTSAYASYPSLLAVSSRPQKACPRLPSRWNNTFDW